MARSNTAEHHGMTHPYRIVFGLLIGLSTACSSSVPLDRQNVVTFERAGTHQTTFERGATRFIDMSMHYLLYLPPGYDAPANARKRWPIVFMLHGVGENGTDPQKLLKYGPARMVELGRDFPFIVVTPQHKGGNGLKGTIWNVELTTALMYDVLERYRVDRDRVYLTGVSSGGLATWVIAANQPHMFAAIAPISSWGYVEEARRIAHVPVWAFHGGMDIFVPAGSIEPLIDAHRAAGGEAKLTIYPGVGHEAWEKAYADQALWDWLLSHRREPMR
jgi:predicted peptidase